METVLTVTTRFCLTFAFFKEQNTYFDVGNVSYRVANAIRERVE